MIRKRNILTIQWIIIILLFSILLNGCENPSSNSIEHTLPAVSDPVPTNTNPETEATAEPKTPKYTVMTWNLAGYDVSDTSTANTEALKNKVATVRILNPDIAVFNECTPDFYETNEDLKTVYNAIIGELDGKNSGNQILYKKELFTEVSAYTYALSDTPTKYSKVDESYHYRFVTIAEFQVKANNETLFVLATHLENNSSNAEIFEQRNQARILQAEHLLEIISSEIPKNSKIILMGDLNSDPQASVSSYRLGGVTELLASNLLEDSRELAFHTDYAVTHPGVGLAIDHILVSPNAFEITSYSVKSVLSIPNPSDHIPVMMTFRMQA